MAIGRLTIEMNPKCLVCIYRGGLILEVTDEETNKF